METEYKKWLTQFRKGYIELAILLLLKSKQKSHGLAILGMLNDLELTINEGTLYPLLNRMEQNKWLSSSWKVPEGKGHPKREYQIDKKGEELLPLLISTYDLHHNIIIKLQEL